MRRTSRGGSGRIHWKVPLDALVEQWLHPKRTHTHDDSGNAHETLSEVDSDYWDLSVHRRETTRVQRHHVFLLFLLVYRDTMRAAHTSVGTRHARVCEVEDTDPTPVEQISWYKVVHVPN